tara:strand:- start:6681 stop:7421 length:741 start_codon:yes stop_codon:yes gene_type:complete
MILPLKSRSNFINEFLTPLGRVNSRCILRIDSEQVFSLISTGDNTIVVYGKHTVDTDIEESVTLNIPDLPRLLKIMQCIDEDDVELDVQSNHIKYESDNIRFKYHLLEDGILTLPPLSIEKINNLEFDTTFKAPFSSFINLIKGSTFALDISKVYFYTKDGAVFAELADKQAHNTDSMSIKLCDGFSGNSIDEPLPVGFEAIRTIVGVGTRCDSIVGKINSKLNVLSFEVNNDNTKMTYIISGLIK